MKQRLQDTLAEAPPRERLGVNALEGLDLARAKGSASQFCISKRIAPVAGVGQGHRDHHAVADHLTIQIASRRLLVLPTALIDWRQIIVCRPA